MQGIAVRMLNVAREKLASGEVKRVLGWEKGEFWYDLTPAFFETEESLNGFVYNGFSGANLSKYLIKARDWEGKTLVFLKPCDTLSFNQLLTEHRIDREKVYVVGAGCKGMLDYNKMKKLGIRKEADVTDRQAVLLGKCLACKGKTFYAFDEVIDDEEAQKPIEVEDRFNEVKKIESLSPEERFAFWRSQLSKCIRCNACRNVCPACSCVKCVFDNPNSGVASKANPDDFEENLFHIIRAFHVAGRCTDCGECSRVCPQGIPLHLLNRKFIKDIDELYGDYQAGLEPGSRAPLVNFDKNDPDPKIVMERGENA